jgi:hypothetical protein
MIDRKLSFSATVANEAGISNALILRFPQFPIVLIGFVKSVSKPLVVIMDLTRARLTVFTLSREELMPL